MKKQDLMIGDYLYDEFGNACVVRYLSDVITLENLEGPNAGEMILGTEFEGIPLTPLLLLRNGYKVNGAIFRRDDAESLIRWRDNNFLFSLYRKHDDLPSENIAIIVRYVHELQHALKMCGIDHPIVEL